MPKKSLLEIISDKVVLWLQEKMQQTDVLGVLSRDKHNKSRAKEVVAPAERMEKMRTLSKNQKLFCRYYSVTRSPREAAGLAGFKNPALQGILLMQNKQIREEIARINAEKVPNGEAAAGLRRLAFGSIADAIKLMMTGGEGLDIDSLDLFCVSEIKMPKGGGTEIKFFDRIKALERLADIGDGSDRSLSPFVEALKKGAERLGSGSGEDGDGDGYGI